MDPPYNIGLERDILLSLENSNIIARDTIIVVEASLETSFDYLKDTKYNIFKQKEYKTNQHVFLELT